MILPILGFPCLAKIGRTDSQNANNRIGLGIKHSAQPTSFWTFNGRFPRDINIDPIEGSAGLYQ